MSIKRKVLGGFALTGDEELSVLAATVLQAMVNNVYFATPLPAIADVNLAWTDYQTKLSIARRKGSPEDTANKNVAKALLADLLRQLAFYVNKTAEGSLPVLLSSGFTLSRYPTAGMVPDVVREVLLQDGRQSGELRIDFRPQRGVLLYEYQYACERDAQGNLQWSDIYNTTSSKRIVLNNLEPFQRYYVQVRAVNGYGKSSWSEAVSHIIR